MNEISNKIAFWYDKNQRDLPWRHTHDPYRIWLSETILQQTRVAQGWDYYLRFVEHYPTVQDLAAASEDEVLKLWQGLGYYSRARNLHTAAMQVTGDESLDGFPSEYARLIKLKGVGPYTAAAIASIAADEEVAVVDGNVYRVLSRLFDLATPIDTGQGQRQFMALATELLPHRAEGGSPGHHNQAMMELGALCCTPTSPKCQDCPVADHCLALANGTVAERPVKSTKVKVRERHLLYIIYIYKEGMWVHQRGAGDIWQGLWEPYSIEIEQKEERETLFPPTPLPDIIQPQLIMEKKHQLTHQTINAQFWVCQLTNDDQSEQLNRALGPKGYRWVSWDDWQGMAVPRLIDEVNRKLSSDWF